MIVAVNYVNSRGLASPMQERSSLGSATLRLPWRGSHVLFSPFSSFTTMFSGTVFTQQREPESDLTLPHSCWAVYDRIDGETSIGQIADTLGLSDPETFAAVRQLQQRDLIEEPTISYPTYKQESSDKQESSEEHDAEGESEQSLPEVSGDGAGGMNGTTTADEEDTEKALHLPTLWNWLEKTTDNVKAYKNTQAFVLMEASDALEAVGVGNMDDLEDMERCSDPEVIQALETAVENNVSERIPEQCYQ